MFNVEMTSTTMELVPLACLCVLTWSGTTFADEHGPAVINMVVKEGNEAILPCSLSSTSIKQEVFDWKKDGQKEVFLYDRGSTYDEKRSGQDDHFKGRVFHFPEHLEFGNASIVIRNTKVADSGNYTCDFPFHQPIRRSHIVLVVGAAPEPSVKILGETQDGVQLQCVVRGASPKPDVQWQDSDGKTLPAEEPQVSERGGSYDIILQTTVTKTDTYRCVATQEEIRHQVHAETYVPVPGAAPEPSVTILEQTKDQALLKCVVRGASPKPDVQWQDSDGKTLPAEEPQVSERGGSYDIILQTTVTKTDTYRCVATQEEIRHQVHAETYVRINVPESHTGWKVSTAVLGVILGVVLLAVLRAKGFIKCSKGQSKKSVPDEEPHLYLQCESSDLVLKVELVSGSGQDQGCGSADRCDGPQVKGPEIKVTEGSDVTLPCSITEDIESWRFEWKKDGQKEVYVFDSGLSSSQGLSGQHEQFKGRVSHFPEKLKNGDASIKIRNTKVADSGNYTCEFRHLPNHKFLLKLLVGAAPKLSLRILEQTKDQALLQCEVHGASPKPDVQWQDSDGKTLPAEAPQVSERGGSYDIILQTTVTKTDTYRCVATQEEIRHQVHAQTHVYICGAAPEPSVTILEQTKDQALLKCVVHGASPKPDVQWQDSDGKTLPAEEPQVSERRGSYDIILQTTVTKTDTYRCVATQEEIRHQVHGQTHVYISVPGFSTGHVVGAVVGTLLVVGVLLAVLRAKGFIKCSKGQSKTSVPDEEPHLYL
ncbi:hemicentin-1-like [Seriola aureovittata]|uniref:hemicentin-1-like n=1 Tax=Seriola aureovittata TaxID=2871759 RepID=UPI0024BE3193|nr:hemicentin-1-like [Seriola aureovittata]